MSWIWQCYIKTNAMTPHQYQFHPQCPLALKGDYCLHPPDAVVSPEAALPPPRAYCQTQTNQFVQRACSQIDHIWCGWEECSSALCAELLRTGTAIHGCHSLCRMGLSYMGVIHCWGIHTSRLPILPRPPWGSHTYSQGTTRTRVLGGTHLRTAGWQAGTCATGAGEMNTLFIPWN